MHFLFFLNYNEFLRVKMKNIKLLLLLLSIFIVLGVYNRYSIEKLDYPFLTDPQIKDGEEFLLSTPDGRYITSCGDCLPNVNLKERCTYHLCTKKYPYQSSVWKYHKNRDGTFNVESFNGKFWKRCDRCEEMCHDVICCDGVNKRLRNCKFYLLKNRDGTVSFKSDTGRILELCNCTPTKTKFFQKNCGKMMCSLGVGKETRFIIERLPKRFPDPVLEWIKIKPTFGNTGKVVPPGDGVILSNLQ